MSGHTEAGVFAIDGGLFALPVTAVREILDRRPAFRVPSAPDWMVGLLDMDAISGLADEVGVARLAAAA